MDADRSGPAGGQQEIRPGPVRPESRHDPDEIVCIAVDKVFDYCFDETTVTRCIPLEGQPHGTPVSCALRTQEATCRIVGNPEYTDGGMANVNVVVTVPATVRVGECHEFTITFPVFRSLQLCIPEGTRLGCEVTGTCFCDLIDANADERSEELCCVANLCVVLHTTARVRLLVPSYGFCAPGPCRDAPCSRPQGHPAGCEE